MTFPQNQIGFMNPVIAGDGELVVDNIHSRGYIAGVSGWEIGRDGSAEFNNVTVRGNFEINGADGSQIAGLTSGGIAQIAERPPTVAGVTWEPGNFFTFLSNPGTDDIPTTVLISPKDAAATSLAPRFHLNGPTAALDQSSIIHFAHTHTLTGLDGIEATVQINGASDGSTGLFVTGAIEQTTDDFSGSVMCADTGWTNLGFNAGYSAQVGGVGFVPAWRWLSPYSVQIRGTVKKGTGAGGAGANGMANGDQPFSGLPAAIQPAEVINTACACQARASNYGVCRMQINTNGTIVFSTSAAHDPGWVDFNVIFDID